ncbi:hypothetical protein Barb7_02931 [Bacteroidales bacterium Barb7]|nr:hypothetical protein Barb7_02931 [Bacteroidales bacterium Barb7]
MEGGISAGKQSGKGCRLINIGEIKADILIDLPLIQQTLEAVFPESMGKVFNVIAPQLVNRDANNQLGNLLLLSG